MDQVTWLFLGDSITERSMGDDGLDEQLPAFGALVAARSGQAPPTWHLAARSGETSADALLRVPEVLARVRGEFVTLAYGTNDANFLGGDPDSEPGSAARFAGRMARLAELVLEHAGTPVIPTLPWGPWPSLLEHGPRLNEALREVWTHLPGILPGPDLWQLFRDRPALIDDDGVHPTRVGYAELRRTWAAFAAALPPSPGRR